MGNSDDFLRFDDNEANGRVQQRSSEPISNRSARRDGRFNQPPPNFREYNRGSRPFTPRSDNPLGDAERSNKFTQTNARFQGRNKAVETNKEAPQFQGRNKAVEANKEAPRMDQSFLEKFKLGFDNKREK